MSSSNWTCEPRPHGGSAFGLTVDADFHIPGLGPTTVAPLPVATLIHVDADEIEGRWRASEATRVSEEGRPAAPPDRLIDVHPTLGYRLYARYFGLCLVAPDGSRLLCAPPPVADWRWQRFLVGRCLPIAALLRGYELLHASAVVVDDGVIAMVGPSGVGKTSLAVRLMLAGARFFTDDVLTLNAVGNGLIAHAGVGVVNLRAHEDATLRADERESIGRLLGRTGRDKLHFAVPTATTPLHLRGLYLLRRGAHAKPGTIRPLPEPDPMRLLSSSFVHQVRGSEHLSRLLDLCARLSRCVPVLDVAIGGDEPAAALADRLLAHAEHLVRA